MDGGREESMRMSERERGRREKVERRDGKKQEWKESSVGIPTSHISTTDGLLHARLVVIVSAWGMPGGHCQQGAECM